MMFLVGFGLGVLVHSAAVWASSWAHNRDAAAVSERQMRRLISIAEREEIPDTVRSLTDRSIN